MMRGVYKAVVPFFLVVLLSACVVVQSEDQPNESESPVIDVHAAVQLEDQPRERELPVIDVYAVGVADAATYVSIEMPESFAFEPYIEPELIHTEDFPFGEYFLFGKYQIDSMTAEMIPIFDYAFMGDGIHCLEEGMGLYALLNSSYVQNYPPISDLPFNRGGSVYPTKDMVDFFRRSRVTYMSEDGERIVNTSRVYGGELENGWEIWDQQIDIYHGAQQEYSMRLHEWAEENWHPWYLYDFQYDVELFDLQGDVVIKSARPTVVFSGFDEKTAYALEAGHGSILQIPNSTNHLLLHNYPENILTVFSLETKSVVYVVSLPEGTVVDQYLGDELLITFGDFGEHGTMYSCTYWVNLQTLETQRVGSYLAQMIGGYFTNYPIVSPDKKLVAYAKPYGPGGHENATEENRLDDMQEGFYITSLETNETTFYSLPTEVYGCEPVCWTSQEGVLGLIEQMKVASQVQK